MDSDFHRVIDENNNIMNVNEQINIGNNVWICTCFTILKGTKINDWTVISASTCRYKVISKCQVIIGINLAKIIKKI